MDKRYLIFVSSTFDDLQEERRKVMEQILNMGHLPVGMELFQASNSDQWDYISQRIAECDYYVLIVGERYGSEALDGISYTEKEFDLAVSLGIPVSAHLISASARETLPRSKVEFDKKDKVNAFRARCENGRVVKYWSHAYELANNVGQSLNELFRVYPRVGLVRGDQVTSPQFANELARLSEENAALRLKISEFEREQGGHSITEVTDALSIVDLKQVYLSYGLEMSRERPLSLLDFLAELHLKYPDGFAFMRMCEFAADILKLNPMDGTFPIEPMLEVVKRLSALGIFHVIDTIGRFDSELPGQIVLGTLGNSILQSIYRPSDILKLVFKSEQ